MKCKRGWIISVCYVPAHLININNVFTAKWPFVTHRERIASCCINRIQEKRVLCKKKQAKQIWWQGPVNTAQVSTTTSTCCGQVDKASILVLWTGPHIKHSTAVQCEDTYSNKQYFALTAVLINLETWLLRLLNDNSKLRSTCRVSLASVLISTAGITQGWIWSGSLVIILPWLQFRL